MLKYLESLVEDDCNGFSEAGMAKRFARDLWVTSAFRVAGSFVAVIKYLEDKKANVFVNFSSYMKRIQGNPHIYFILLNSTRQDLSTRAIIGSTVIARLRK